MIFSPSHSDWYQDFFLFFFAGNSCFSSKSPMAMMDIMRRKISLFVQTVELDIYMRKLQMAWNITNVYTKSGVGLATWTKRVNAVVTLELVLWRYPVRASVEAQNILTNFSSYHPGECWDNLEIYLLPNSCLFIIHDHLPTSLDPYKRSCVK
jgi:hypothetical protein